MKKIFLFGYSGHSLVVNDCIPNSLTVSGYFDPNKNENNPLGIHYLGNEQETELQQLKGLGFVFPSVGNNANRKKMRALFLKHNLSETTLIHPRAVVSPSSTIGVSTLIGPNAVVNAKATIGDGVIINSSAIIEHECSIADYAHIAPGAVLAGNVTIGEAAFIGANAVVKEGQKIGHGSIIGAGSVVLCDIPKMEVWAGVPAKKIRSLEK